MSIKPWKVLQSEYVLKNRWATVRSDSCLTDEGVTVEPYFVLESEDWVHVLALSPDNKVLLTRQYRHGIGEVFLELPAGCVDAGESPAEAMARELLEETGCRAEHMDALPPLSPNPARYDNTVYPFVAFGVEQVAEPVQDSSEHIEFEFVPVSRLLAMIATGEFRAGLHFSAVYLGLQRAGLLPLDVPE